MLVYTATKSEFCEDVRTNRIEARILDRLKETVGRSTSESEIRSWRNSMQYMFHIIEPDSVPNDIGLAIEYNIPRTSKRIDFLLSGLDQGDCPTAVIIELKQWEKVGITHKDAIVETFLGKGMRETLHPSYQAWSYAQLLYDFNEHIYTDKPRLLPCAYLHNCKEPEAIRSSKYNYHLNKAPVYLQDESKELTDYISENVTRGDSGQLLIDIENSRIRPSKDLADHMASLLDGNQEFLMIDDQKIVYETALELANEATNLQKKVLVVKGGPGTGKSVVAINLLVELIKRQKNPMYLSTNQAPRSVYSKRLSGTMRKSRIDNLFKGTASFVNADRGLYDCLIVDEAHRLVEKVRFTPNGENQIKEIIHAANCSVFFIDESQRVTMKDIGTVDGIKDFAKELGADLLELDLQSQFRCNGSDGYLNWLDNTLGIKETANLNLSDVDYEFQVCSSPTELIEFVREKNQTNNKSRLVAGYCWPWISKKDLSKNDIVFEEYDFAMQWNFQDSGATWLIEKDSVEQIGCIHTCQGLELDYVGVILGRDFLIRNGKPICDFNARAKNDSSWKGFKKMLKENESKAIAKQNEIVKNTYRVLMSRGQKGCYIWSVDDETNDWFRQRI